MADREGFGPVPGPLCDVRSPRIRARTLSFTARSKDEISLKERQHFRKDSPTLTPIARTPNAIIFLRLVHDAKLIQLMSKRLVGVDMILIRVAARPVELEPSQRL